MGILNFLSIHKRLIVKDNIFSDKAEWSLIINLLISDKTEFQMINEVKIYLAEAKYASFDKSF